MDCNTCKNSRRLQLWAKMNCRGYKTYTWAAEQLAWNKLIVIDRFAWIEPVAHLSERNVCTRVKWISVTSYHVVCSIHTSEHSVNIRTNSAMEKFNKCHFTIIMSCVESTIRKFRKIRLSGVIALRVIFAVGNTLFFIAWIKFEFFITFWLRHVFTITFVIISYTKNFSRYPS